MDSAEFIMYVIMGIFLVFIFAVLVVCVLKDYKISKEWERIFKKGDRDD